MLASWAKSALLGPIPSPPNSMRRQEDPTRSATVYPRGLRPSHLQVGPDRQDRLFPLAWTLLELNAELAQQPPHARDFRRSSATNPGPASYKTYAFPRYPSHSRRAGGFTRRGSSSSAESLIGIRLDQRIRPFWAQRQIEVLRLVPWDISVAMPRTEINGVAMNFSPSRSNARNPPCAMDWGLCYTTVGNSSPIVFGIPSSSLSTNQTRGCGLRRWIARLQCGSAGWSSGAVVPSLSEVGDRVLDRRLTNERPRLDRYLTLRPGR